ncbi:T-complex protein 1 subunit beta, partial [Tanacetum coccineum]
VGNETTSIVVWPGELLKEAAKLLAMKIHPMTIFAGYRTAADHSRTTMLERVKDKKEYLGLYTFVV